MSAAEKSIREELEAAMRVEPEPEPEVVEDEPEPSTETAEERARDDKGRFVAKDKPEVEPEVEVETPVIEAQPEPEKDEKRDSPLAPPNGWPAEAKAKWHELSPEIMQAVQKREQDIAKFTSQRDEHASFGKEMYQAVQPYMAQIQAEGGTPSSAVKSLLNTAYVLRTGSPEQKRQLLLQTARQFGVDLGEPASGPQAQVPDVSSLVRQEMERATNQRLQAEVQQEIEAFAADPKHAHYAEVKAHMAALLSSGAAKDLQDAYDQACWVSPTVRATLEAQKRAEEEQKRRAEAKAKAEAAKRRSIGITGGPGVTAGKPAPESRSLRDELEAQFSASSGAV